MKNASPRNRFSFVSSLFCVSPVNLRDFEHHRDEKIKNRGNTALHYAFAFGFQQLGKYLASSGADDTLLNDQG